MTVEDFKSWLTVILSAIALIGTVWNWINAGSKKTATDLDDYKARMEVEIDKLRDEEARERKVLLEAVQALGQRTMALESDMKHLPDAKAMMEMRLALSDLKGQVGRMEENQLGVSRTVHRVEDFLLANGKAA